MALVRLPGSPARAPLGRKQTGDTTESLGRQGVPEAGSLGRRGRRWAPRGPVHGAWALTREAFSFLVPLAVSGRATYTSAGLHFLSPGVTEGLWRESSQESTQAR